MDDVGTFYVHMVYFMAIRHILWTIGTFCDHLVYIWVNLVCCTKVKSGNTDPTDGKGVQPEAIKLA
jgi:hypothetical protein